MSMTIVVWAACSLSVPSDLPESESWKNYGRNDWAYETALWQVSVESAPNSNVPDEVKSIDSRASEAVFATVEPINAGVEAYRFLNSVVVVIATKCGGAILEGPMGFVRLDAHGKEIKS